MNPILWLITQWEWGTSILAKVHRETFNSKVQAGQFGVEYNQQFFFIKLGLFYFSILLNSPETIYPIFLLTVFEQRTSGVGSNHSVSCIIARKQINQMALVFVQYLTIQSNGTMPKSIFLPKLTQNFTLYQINPQTDCQSPEYFTKVAKYRQFWSHCPQAPQKSFSCFYPDALSHFKF